MHFERQSNGFLFFLLAGLGGFGETLIFLRLLRALCFVMSERINIESETTLYKLGMVMITHDNNLFKKFKTDSNLSFSMSLK